MCGTCARTLFFERHVYVWYACSTPWAIKMCHFISPHGIAVPKGLYFTAVVSFFFVLSFFRRLISEVTKRISTKLGHIFTYGCYLKNLVRTLRAFTPTGWGKKTFFGTDFELWPKVSLQRNISTIAKKFVNLQRLPYMLPKFRKLWSRNSWKRLVSFGKPPKFSLWETRPALPHGRYITDSRQTLARVI